LSGFRSGGELVTGAVRLAAAGTCSVPAVGAETVAAGGANLAGADGATLAGAGAADLGRYNGPVCPQPASAEARTNRQIV